MAIGDADTKRRLLDLLKRRSPLAVKEAATSLGVTAMAVRQHLADFEARGLVEGRVDDPGGRPGRPTTRWLLTDLAVELFPDRHSDLTLELLDAIREAVGEEGLDRVIDARGRRQVDAYRALLPRRRASLRRRVEALADQRTAEGYMAEVKEDDDGSHLLIEHHCPVCEAATSCTGICRAELDVFRQALGAGVSVEREQHLLSGDERCVYRIRRASS